jgi:hypothetical protein
MPERPGGFERQDIDACFRALAGAENAGEIEPLIETPPVLRSPRSTSGNTYTRTKKSSERFLARSSIPWKCTTTS